MTASTNAPLVLPSLPPSPLPVRVRARIGAMLDSTFATTFASAQHYSVSVIDASGTLVYGRNENVAVTPASTQKLIVASAALDLLGPNYRFHTLVAAPSGIRPDGSVAALYLVGSGDPSLRSSDLSGAASALAASGVRRSDALIVDASSISSPEINPHWDTSDAGENFQTATSGISLDGDTAEFDITGASQNGESASVRVVPEGAPLHVDGSIMTGDADTADVAAEYAPNTFRLSGAVPAGQHRKAWLPVHGIAQYAGVAFAAALRRSGVVVQSAPGVGRAPLDSAALWTHESQPLRALVHHMLYWSDNHYAEQLLRTLGREERDDGSDAAGFDVERAFLRTRHLSTAGLHVVDGSGLSVDNRVPSLALARLLSDAELRGGLQRLYDLLPTGGKEGTLKYYRFDAAAGRVHAKSGHLSGIEGLAGYVDTRTYGRLAFAFIINHAQGDPDSEIVAALDRLASF